MVLSTVAISPFGDKAFILIKFWSFSKVTVVEKSPWDDGFTTSWSELVTITIVASGIVFPEIIRVLFDTTSSFTGLLIDKNIVGFGVTIGVGFMETAELGETVLVV